MGTEQGRHDNPPPYEWPSTMDGPGRTDAHRETCDWLRANGLDPKEIPVNPKASLADGSLTLQRFVLNQDGKRIFSPDRGEFMTETVTLSVTTPPTPLVEIWLAPKCPTCGR